MPRTPVEVRPANTRTSSMREADALAALRRQQHVVLVAAGLDRDQALAFLQLHRDQAVGADIREVRQLVAPHGAHAGCEHDAQRIPCRLVLRQRHDGRYGLALFQRQQVDQRLALARSGCRWAGGRPSACRRCPRVVKNSIGVCVLAMNRSSTESSSLVTMPVRPLPPRRCAR